MKYLLTIPIEADDELHDGALDLVLSEATYAASVEARMLGARVGSPCRYAHAPLWEDIDNEAYAKRRLIEEAALRALEATVSDALRRYGAVQLGASEAASCWAVARRFVEAGEETP